MEDETMSGIALILATVAVLGVVIGAGYMYFNQPEEVDLRDMFENSIAINALGNEIEDLEKDMKSEYDNIEFDLEHMQDEIDDIPIADISKGDLEDLDDYANEFKHIEENQDDIVDINKILDCINDADNVTLTNVRTCIAALSS